MSNYWTPDKWYEVSEAWYLQVFAGGVCRYCGAGDKAGPMALCECNGLLNARAAYQARLRAGSPETGTAAQIEPKPAGYKDFTEPKERLF